MFTLRFAPITFARAFSSSPKPQVCRVSLIGRLGTVPESQTTPNGKDVIRYTVGVNRGYGEQQQTAWWRISSFADPTSKIAEKMLTLPKGTQVFIEGDMWNSKYEGADGKVHNSISINQTKIEVLRRPGPKLEENADEQGRE